MKFHKKNLGRIERLIRDRIAILILRTHHKGVFPLPGGHMSRLAGCMPPPPRRNHSLRYDGAILVVAIDYDNTRGFNQVPRPFFAASVGRGVHTPGCRLVRQKPGLGASQSHFCGFPGATLLFGRPFHYKAPAFSTPTLSEPAVGTSSNDPRGSAACTPSPISPQKVPKMTFLTDFWERRAKSRSRRPRHCLGGGPS